MLPPQARNNESSLIYSYDKILNASELFGEVPESTYKGRGRAIYFGMRSGFSMPVKGEIFKSLVRGAIFCISHIHFPKKFMLETYFCSVKGV